MNDLERDTVLRELSVLSGKTFPAKFFRRKRTNPAVKGLYEYHNLVRGIYKPTGCEMATAILQTLKGPYTDTLRYDDGAWLRVPSFLCVKGLKASYGVCGVEPMSSSDELRVLIKEAFEGS